MKLFLLSLKLLFILSSSIFAQGNFRDTLSTDYPYLNYVDVGSLVEQSNDFYFYKYSLINSGGNDGIIVSFRINLKEDLTFYPDTTGLKFKNSYVEFSFRNIYDLIQGKIAPASSPSSPGRWTGSLSKFSEASFSGSPFISPGDSLSGFVLQSRGLPKVRELTVYPRFEVEKYFQSLDDPNLTQTFEEMDSLRNMVNYYGYTLGPWLPDSTMSLDSFTDTLETFRFRSCEELDWATDATVCRELADDLSAVKANLQAGDSLSAANALSNFIELVEQEKGESLTSEGYALLYFNAKYLAERLPEPRIKR